MPDISFRDEIRRKAVHLSSFWMPVLMMSLAMYRWYLALFFVLLTIGSLLVEHAYANGNQRVIRLYNIFFGGMLRKKLQPGAWVISGGPPVLAAAAVALLLFPSAVAAASLALMLAGDTAAALIGKRWGRVRFFNGKSLEGAIAFVLAGTLFAWLFLLWGGANCQLSLIMAFPAAIAGMLAEFFEKQLHVDDNLGIPVAAGIMMLVMLKVLF